ncbi:methylmalonyl-CoA carboxyltransferase [Granulicella sp. WH15]|uniref:acyl-CoA carboxylase subunit beta n=1 Tax=Granulicella sp. WH15 TaxID=2602070 RepID=UPI0013669CA6|nr:carboxyl transferase domain-containing protein [Granulicella sp. WH15]QHN02473.1 methylmalonyl-CoA carboxyltransferase [Granulicella sp. WH15]
MPSSSKLPKPTPQEARLAELEIRNRFAEQGVGAPARGAGRLSARERIALLLDEGSFVETGKLVTHRAVEFGMQEMRVPGDGCITGHGKVQGRVVFVFAQDASVFGGTLSEANAAKIVATMNRAMSVGAPIIGLYDSQGIRIEDGISALAGMQEVLLSGAKASGVVPQIAVLLGPATEGTLLAASIADFIVARDYVTENVSDVAHLFAADDEACIRTVRELLGFLPSSYRDVPPMSAYAGQDADVPEIADEPYDMVDAISKIVDKGYLLQVQEHHARNLIVGFARMEGRTVGIVANQPLYLDGALDGDAAAKGARFVRLCDAFNVPILTFEDAPGFLPGTIQHSAKLLCAYAEATVPKLTVVMRRAYGAASCVMGAKAGLSLAWPSAEITVMAPEDAVDVIHRREFEEHLKHAQAMWPQGMAFSEEKKSELLTRLREEKIAVFRERFAHPYNAAERAYVDAVIYPNETRRRLIDGLDMLARKHLQRSGKKHERD